MRCYGSARWIFSLMIVGLLSLGMASSATAGATEQYKKQAAQFEKMLEQQAKAPGAEAAKEDIERTRKWLDNAKVLLAKGSDDAAARLLKRVKASLDLVAAQVQAGSIQAAADDQEEAFYKAKEKQIPELEAEIQKLKDKQQGLKQELSKLR